MFRGFGGFSGARRRKALSNKEQPLQEPLIPLDGSQADYSADEDVVAPSASAATIHYAQPADWQYMITNVAGVCVETFNSICTALSSCFWQGLGFPIPKPLLPPVELSLVQERRLADLKTRITVLYDTENKDHQDKLRRLWELSFPGEPCTSLRCARWKDMGWQNEDPASDFRGGGLLSLESLTYMAAQHPETFTALKDKSAGQRSDWEYPFAAAGVNLTFLLVEALGLRGDAPLPATTAGRNFCALLGVSDNAFEEVFVSTYELLDRLWLDTKASYMEFPGVLKSTRERLEQVFSNQVCSVAEVRSMLAA